MEKTRADFAGTAMLCQGTEEYGIGTIQKLYGRGTTGLWFICFAEGPLTAWLRAEGCRVDVVAGGLGTLTMGTSATGLAALPGAWMAARRDAERVDRLVGRAGVRILHTHWLPQQLIAGHMREMGYKSVWQINNNTSRTRLLGMGVRLNHAIARWGADLLLPCSDYIASNWVGSGVAMRTIRNAAEPLHGGPSHPPTDGPVRCMVAGRLEESKGHHLAVEAVCAARRAGLDVRLDLFGGPVEGNPYAAQLRRTIREAGAEDAIRLMGFRQDLRALHRDYHVGLQCRVDPEPCSLWVCETLVDGLPLIASASGGTPELVTDGESGFLFQPGNASDLAVKLAVLVRDRRRLDAMRAAAFERGAQHFTAGRFVTQTLQAYRTLSC